MTKPSPDELLAAYAHDPSSLTAEERAEVEAVLAGEPGARAEADALARAIVAVRALPSPSAPPSLARSIAEALAAEPMPSPSAWARLRAWILRPAVGVGVAMVAAGGLALWVATRPAPHDAGTTHVPTATRVDVDAGGPTAPAREPAPLFGREPATAGELADLDGLDEHALDQLDRALAPADDDDGGAAAASGDDGLIPDPDLGWVDELSAADVDSLDRYLDQQHRSPT